MSNKIIQGDCLKVLPTLPDKFVRLIYFDAPFNTGKTQKRDRIKVVADEGGDRVGFGGKTYKTEKVSSGSYEDSFDDFPSFLMPRIEAALHCLTPDGSLFVHLDCREVHYIKVALDKLLGREHFMNEIIWSYDFGARSKTKWPMKHDNILWYAMNPKEYIFNYEDMDRIPYLAPELVGPEKASIGKTPTDCWFHTIVPTNGKEKCNYPTQKPMGILNRIIKIHSKETDTVMDFFAGSGSLAHSAALLGRSFVMIDSNKEAIDVMEKRLADFKPEIVREKDDALTD